MNSTLQNHQNGPVSAEHPSPIPQKPDWIPSIAAGLLGLAGFAVAAVVLPRFRLSAGQAALAISAASALPMGLYECFRIKTKTGGVPLPSRRSGDAKPDVQRVLTKVLGLLATAALLVAAYWLLPFYRAKPFEPFREIGAILLPVWIAAAVPYFFWLDARIDHPEDGYWQLGRLVLLKPTNIDRKVLQQHFLTWAVKGFFLPLMFAGLALKVFKLHWTGGWPVHFLPIYTYGLNALYTLDLTFAVAGYSLTLRAFGSHVRSVEPTILGWVSALICYEPFWDGIGSNFVSYESPSRGASEPWMAWLHASPLSAVWGSIILLIVAVYTSATICFGIRFSNLTHRGIIGFGPYYFTKHPAYLAKLISYALLSVPFVPFGGAQEAVRRSLMFCLLIAIYRVRAVTEERHLSSDPTYLVYMERIKERHQRWFGPIFSILGFQRRNAVPAATQCL